KIDSIVKELKQTKKENDDLKNKLSSSEVKDVLGTYEQVNDTKIIKAIIDNADMSQLRNLADRVKDRYNDAAAVFIGKSDKPSMVIAVTKKACEKGISANKIIKEAAAYIAGSGGGREDMAQAGGKDSSNAEKALQKAVDMIKEVLNNG
ncbi:MAG: DHHA1 domain-containing protein, partial [Clostridia bacterium]|nr:DHHA1 domain-containing protein [Clostridia bacterium]